MDLISTIRVAVLTSTVLLLALLWLVRRPNLQVRNNREYDALTKEIEAQKQRIQEGERKKMARQLEQRKQDSVLAQRNAIFGQHIFSTEFRLYKRSGNFIPPEDYILGPGDNLIVAVWDGNELYETLSIDEEGAVFRQFLGKIEPV